MAITAEVGQVIDVIERGGLVAYPTEAIFGLGCDPFNDRAVQLVLELKQRPIEQGVILVAANLVQLEEFIKPELPEHLDRAMTSWPGPDTWIFPASDSVPAGIVRSDSTVAVRVTAHPSPQMICRALGRAIVSTSANLRGQAPARNAAAVARIFGSKIDCVLDAPVGGDSNPSQIRIAATGEIIRTSTIAQPTVG